MDEQRPRDEKTTRDSGDDARQRDLGRGRHAGRRSGWWQRRPVRRPPGKALGIDGRADAHRRIAVAAVTFALTALVLNGSELKVYTESMQPGWRRDLAADVNRRVEDLNEVVKLDTAREWLSDRFGGWHREQYPQRAGVTAKTPRVALVGDSLMENLAPRMRSELIARFGAEVAVRTERAAPLDDDLLVDWSTEARELVDRFDPDVVYVWLHTSRRSILAVNLDGEVIGVDDPRWVEWCAEQFEELSSELSRNGAAVIWIEDPPMGLDDLEAGRGATLAALRLAISRSDGRMSSTRIEPALSSDGEFTTHLRIDGKLIKVRDQDGLHITEQGAREVVTLLLQQTGDSVRERGGRR